MTQVKFSAFIFVSLLFVSPRSVVSSALPEDRRELVADFFAGRDVAEWEDWVNTKFGRHGPVDSGISFLTNAAVKSKMHQHVTITRILRCLETVWW